MMTELTDKLGITIRDPWDVVTIFERELARYAGSKYAVCLDSCSNALYLCLKYLKITGETLDIPKNTYASVPMQIIHSGNYINFIDLEWSGEYYVGHTPIVDAATKFCKGMYLPQSYYCLSFHHRKTLKIGRGGAILHTDPKFDQWVRPMIYDGRHKEVMYSEDTLSCIGYHMYMTPEDAAVGLLKLRDLPNQNPDTGSNLTYKDLSLEKVFNSYVRKT
jgi:dTDP-4-amino-4,6-dideoxygalactose transaminase